MRSLRRSDGTGAGRRTSSAKDGRTGRGGGSGICGSGRSSDFALSLSAQTASGSGAMRGGGSSAPMLPGSRCGS